MSNSNTSEKFSWFRLGDLNGFFGLMFDNLAVMSFLAGILIFAFGFPAEIVYKKMFPGTAFGVFVGDLIYTIMAYQVYKKTGNARVTAMPLGLDTPSTIGIALVVLGPAFLGFKQMGMGEQEAAMMTWYVGMATMILTGIFKLIMSFCGAWIQKMVPQAGLLGSLAGIGLVLIGFGPLLEVFGLPIVGMIALGLVLYNLVARITLPGKIPGLILAIGLGTLLYHVLGLSGMVPGIEYKAIDPTMQTGSLPIPTMDFMKGMKDALIYIPISLPFAILTVIGGINVTESAKVAGDDFNTQHILLTEAFATLVAGFCGGVAQSTPYIGQPAYKKMGAGVGYTLATGILIGLGGVVGYVSFLVELIPKAVLAPILIFVALDIVAQAFIACPKRHAPAVAFAFFPTLARLLAIKYGTPDIVPAENFKAMLAKPGHVLPESLVTVAMGNGFILTAMLWGGFLAEMIDRNLKKCSLYLVILAVLTFFGIIHSAIPDGSMYNPFNLTGLAQQIPFQFTIGYLLIAAMVFLLSFSKESKEPFEEEEEEEKAHLPASDMIDEEMILKTAGETNPANLTKTAD